MMKKFTLSAFTLLAMAAPVFAAGSDVEIKNVSVQFIQSPEYAVNPPIHQARSEKWMEVEVTFEAKPDFTPELAFNYYIFFAKHLIVGHVNHVNIPKGRELRSVAYVSPNAIGMLTNGRQFTGADLENVSVTVTSPGVAAPMSMKSFKPSTGEWWAALKQEEGFVVNKSETPFAPLFWDRYVPLKPTTSH